MLNWIIDASLRHRFAVIALVAVVAVAGILSLQHLDIDAQTKRRQKGAGQIIGRTIHHTRRLDRTQLQKIPTPRVVVEL